MEILIFSYNGDILLVLDKDAIDEETDTKQILQMLQHKLETEYKRDWDNIEFQGSSMAHPLYIWQGDNGNIQIFGKTHTVRDITEEVFPIVNP